MDLVTACPMDRAADGQGGGRRSPRGPWREDGGSVRAPTGTRFWSCRRYCLRSRRRAVKATPAVLLVTPGTGGSCTGSGLRSATTPWRTRRRPGSLSALTGPGPTLRDLRNHLAHSRLPDIDERACPPVHLGPSGLASGRLPAPPAGAPLATSRQEAPGERRITPASRRVSRVHCDRAAPATRRRTPVTCRLHVS